MKKLLLPILLLAGASALIGQNYSFDPSANVSGTVAVGSSITLNIDIHNLKTSTLQLSWMLHENPFDTTLMKVQICDNVSCVDPDSGRSYSMNNIPVGGKSWLKGVFTAKVGPSSGIVKVLVWERGDSLSPDTVSYDVSSFVGVADPAPLGGITWGPNPAHDQLALNAEQPLSEAALSIFDLSGRELLRRELPSGQSWLVDVAALPAGLHVMQITSSQGSHQARLVKE